MERASQREQGRERSVCAGSGCRPSGRNLRMHGLYTHRMSQVNASQIDDIGVPKPYGWNQITSWLLKKLRVPIRRTGSYFCFYPLRLLINKNLAMKVREESKLLEIVIVPCHKT